MRDAFVRTVTRLAAADPQTALITGDLGFGVLTDFAKRFPNQFVNAGVAEQNMTAIACGMALSGWRAYTYSIANFTTLRPLEQIRNDVCYHCADVTIVSVGGGFSYGQLGMSHFATEDLAIMRALPNMRIIVPSEDWETEDLTSLLAEEPGPAYLRLDKGKGGSPRPAGHKTEIGKARIVRQGTDVCFISIGAILSECLKAADMLAGEGISARVLSVSSLKPFDEDAVIAAARETGGVVTVEEHTIVGGLGGAAAETLLEAGVTPGFFRRIGLNDCYPTVVGDQDYLRAAYKMDGQAIADAARRGLRGRN
jgi:transketolase